MTYVRFQLMVHHPMQWPYSKHIIPAGAHANVVIKPTFSYATPDVKRLAIGDRNCLFPDEIAKLKVKTLLGTQYMRENCIAACRQSYTISLCNCTLDFLYPDSNYRKCNVSALKCLNKYMGELFTCLIISYL